MNDNDKVVYIADQSENYNFTRGKIYVITYAINQITYLPDNNGKGTFFHIKHFIKMFIPLKEYRKQKLLKLNK